MYPIVSNEQYKKDREIFDKMNYYQNSCIKCEILFDTHSKYRLYCYECLPSKNE